MEGAENMKKVIYVSDDDQELIEKWEKLKNIADAEDRSLSYLVNKIISDYVDKK
jgi:predicted transcriptional regulator